MSATKEYFMKVAEEQRIDNWLKKEFERDIFYEEQYPQHKQINPKQKQV